MKKLISIFTILATTIIITNSYTKPAFANDDDNNVKLNTDIQKQKLQAPYDFYLGTALTFDFNNTNFFMQKHMLFHNSNKHNIFPELFFGYNLDKVATIEINLTDNNYSNSNNNYRLKAHGYTTTVQFIGDYPLTDDQKLNTYGLVGMGVTYWDVSINNAITKRNFNLSTSIGIGLKYKITDIIEVSTGYKLTYLGKPSESSYIPSKNVFRHQLETRLKFDF